MLKYVLIGYGQRGSFYVDALSKKDNVQLEIGRAHV